MKQPLVQILVLVANIHMRTMKTEVEKGSMSTAVGHGLVGPKTICNYFQGRFLRLCQKGVRLIFLNYMLWC